MDAFNMPSEDDCSIKLYTVQYADVTVQADNGNDNSEQQKQNTFSVSQYQQQVHQALSCQQCCSQ